MKYISRKKGFNPFYVTETGVTEPVGNWLNREMLCCFSFYNISERNVIFLISKLDLQYSLAYTFWDNLHTIFIFLDNACLAVWLYMIQKLMLRKPWNQRAGAGDPKYKLIQMLWTQNSYTHHFQWWTYLLKTKQHILVLISFT